MVINPFLMESIIDKYLNWNTFLNKDAKGHSLTIKKINLQKQKYKKNS